MIRSSMKKQFKKIIKSSILEDDLYKITRETFDNIPLKDYFYDKFVKISEYDTILWQILIDKQIYNNQKTLTACQQKGPPYKAVFFVG